ncbi:MAG: hypothetical protein H7196_05250 [candidate division SR1 bacterium]|nr:hypothetical protein [candidate division SR1 bacterium]
MDNTQQKSLLSKVPEITLYFWIIKVLCTTVGQTMADYLNTSLNLGLNGTSLVIGALLVIALFFQFKTKTYTSFKYWIVVFLLSIFGTLIVDNLTDNLGISLGLSTTIFTILLGLTFLIWYSQEKTTSIKSITNWKREAFYWVIILFTFALGTASGDFISKVLGIGYLGTGIAIPGLIGILIYAKKLGMNSILVFWSIYILTRPLGASIGDYLSQSSENGGLGLGTSITSLIFSLAILIVIGYLSITKKDLIILGNQAESKYRV